MTLKDLWELLTETWNAWSIHKAPRRSEEHTSELQSL